MMLPINTVKMRLNVNFIDDTSFQKTMFQSPHQKCTPLNIYIALEDSIYKIPDSRT